MKINLNIFRYPFLFLCLTLGGGTAFSQTFTVNCGDGTGDDLHLVFNGTTLGSNGQPLQDGDTVNVSGICYANGVAFVVNKRITLNGVGGASGSKPIIDARSIINSVQLNTVLQALAPININNLTLQNGRISGLQLAGQSTTILSTLTNSTVINNNVDSFFGTSAAISVISNFEIINSTVTHNSIGVSIAPGFSAKITHSTITNNAAYGILSNGTVQLDKNIIAGNNTSLFLFQDINVNSGTLTLNSYNLYGTTQGSVSVVGSTNTQESPSSPANLDTLKDNGGLTPTIALNSGSAAINKITTGDCISTNLDQRGAPRPGAVLTGNKPGCDSGAYETGDAKLVVSTAPTFPDTKVGVPSAPSIVGITNAGNNTATFSGAASINPNPDNAFAISTAPTVTSLPVTAVSPSFLSITFTPSKVGANTGVLNIPYIYNSSSAVTSLTAALSGNGTPAVIPPSTQMKDILNYFKQGISSNPATIYGVGKNKLIAKLRLIAFGAELVIADQLITKTRYNDACVVLRLTVKQSDGANNPADFITGSGVPTLNGYLIDLRSALNCGPLGTSTLDKIKDNDAGTVLDH